MKRNLSFEVRSRVAEKVMEMGNLILTALVLGQALRDQVNLIVAFFGAAGFFFAYYFAIKVMKRR